MKHQESELIDPEHHHDVNLEDHVSNHDAPTPCHHRVFLFSRDLSWEESEADEEDDDSHLTHHHPKHHHHHRYELEVRDAPSPTLSSLSLCCSTPFKTTSEHHDVSETEEDTTSAEDDDHHSLGEDPVEINVSLLMDEDEESGNDQQQQILIPKQQQAHASTAANIATTPSSLVRFSVVQVQEYSLTLGDHPCTQHYPISLDWQHTPVKEMSLRDYEAWRHGGTDDDVDDFLAAGPLSVFRRRLSQRDRRGRICQVTGLSMEEIESMEHIRKIHLMQEDSDNDSDSDSDDEEDVQQQLQWQAAQKESKHDEEDQEETCADPSPMDAYLEALRLRATSKPSFVRPIFASCDV